VKADRFAPKVLELSLCWSFTPCVVATASHPPSIPKVYAKSLEVSRLLLRRGRGSCTHPHFCLFKKRKDFTDEMG
jgi:hypothetical protein